MSNENSIREDLHDLLNHFQKKAFSPAQCVDGSLQYEVAKKTEELFRRDYNLTIINNYNGTLCGHYPARILIPEYENGNMASTVTANPNAFKNRSWNRSATTTTSPTKTPSFTNNLLSNNSNCLDTANGEIRERINNYITFADHLEQSTEKHKQTHTNLHSLTHTSQRPQKTIYEDQLDVYKIRELMAKSKYGRCRLRFVVPVIMYRGKYICRSATISVLSEAYTRKAINYAYGVIKFINPDPPNLDYENNEPTEESLGNKSSQQSPFTYEEVIKSDKLLMKEFKISTIIDLMVEDRKTKLLVPVSSSEKAAPESYGSFNILSTPYPGCEFFKRFRANNYEAKGLYYNWTRSFNNAELYIPRGPALDLDIFWDEYKNWDLIELTQNYLKSILKYIQEESSGILIHCISGWDRTPLFISLVRLSLWADGLIHQSLTPEQMTYLTLAYDWYLFGHQLPTRLSGEEDIMFFCFHVLKFLTEEEFSIMEHRKRTKTSSSSGSSGGVIFKQDYDDEQFRDINLDQDSNDSFSNGFTCDTSNNDNIVMTVPLSTSSNSTSPNSLTNRSPSSKRSRTSPITVPGSNARRQRQESTSSTGSWQVVTETGSLESSMNGSYMMQNAQEKHYDCDLTTGCSHGTMLGNCCRGATGTTRAIGSSTQVNLRRQRLSAVRSIFIQSYAKAIGLKFQEGSSMNITTFIGALF